MARAVVGILILSLPLMAKVAESRPVVLFALMQRLRDLEVNPSAGLLGRHLAGPQAIAAEAGAEQAELTHPVEGLERLLEVPIQVGQSFIGERF